MSRKPIVALDVGTTKICTIIAELRGEDLVIKGIGINPSHGLRKGFVVDVNETASSISKAIKRAEDTSGMKISSVYIGVAGSHVESFNNRGGISIKGKDHKITAEDIDAAVEASCPTDISPDRDILHIIPRSFLIDGQEGVKDPEGMAALRLDVESHIVTAAITSLQNMIKCVRMAGYGVEDIILQQIASSEAVLTDAEKENGTVLVDIGGGTTDVAAFSEGSICHSWVLSVGGSQVTKDLAVGLNISLEEAEDLKKEQGYALSKDIDEMQVIEINTFDRKGARPILRKYVVEIIESRVREIFDLVRKELIENDLLDFLPGGIVITGGTSQLEGLEKMITEIFRLPVRVGYPQKLEGSAKANSPVFATGIGLLIYGKKSTLGEVKNLSENKNIINEFLDQVLEWIRNIFKK